MNTKILIKSLALAAAVLPLRLAADVQPAALFADHMVIQQKTRAPIWGTGDAGEAVVVTGSWGEKAQTVVGEDGRWRVELLTPPAGGPYTLNIHGNNLVEINDVLAGEVWICSGQSNMDFTLNQLRRSKEGRTEEGNVKEAEFIDREIVSASDSMFRQFTVTKNTSAFEEVHTLSGSWKLSAPENNGDFSATAYFFGKELRSRLQVPVGLIKCAWGGTRVEAWMPAEAFQRVIHKFRPILTSKPGK